MQSHETTAMILASPTRRPVPAGGLRMEGGQPVRRFVKELIRCGQYVKQADNFGFTVTPEVLDHWCKTTAAYLSAGNKIPVPATHTDDPEANRGWVVDVFAEDQSLFATIDLVGDGIKLAGTCDVSIYSPPELVDGHGNRYTRPIVHVALCTDPVVPGLAGFVPIETSRGGNRQTVRVPILKLQEQVTMPDPLNPNGAPATDSGAAVDPAEAIVQAIMGDKGVRSINWEIRAMAVGFSDYHGPLGDREVGALIPDQESWLFPRPSALYRRDFRAERNAGLPPVPLPSGVD